MDFLILIKGILISIKKEANIVILVPFLIALILVISVDLMKDLDNKIWISDLEIKIKDSEVKTMGLKVKTLDLEINSPNNKRNIKILSKILKFC